MPDFHPRPDDGGSVVEYLLEEISFSTCSNDFFGELEKEMLIPNNINIYGRIKRAAGLKEHKLKVELPDESTVGYLKQPLSNTIEGTKRVLTYNLENLIDFDDYWWFPLHNETVFSLPLNLLPPFPRLHTVGLNITCRPDVAVGLNADVTTTVRLEAEEDVDNIYLRINTNPRPSPGINVMVTEYSDDIITEPRQSVGSPKKEFPFPRITMKEGETREYRVKTRITADLSNMNFLRCEQSILTAKLITLTNSSPQSLPCGVTILDGRGRELPVSRAIRSNVYQAVAQIMYSPFSVKREALAVASTH